MQGPTALTPAQVQLAVKPTLGGEIRLFATRDTALELASINIVAANSGVNNSGSPYGYNNTIIGTISPGTTAMDLAVVADSVISDTAPVVVTVFGLNQNNVSTSGIATFKVPAYATVTDYEFETGWMVDVVPANAGDQFTSYTGFAISCTSAAANGTISIWAMPNTSRYTQIAATQDSNIHTKAQQPTAISAGMDEGAYIKRGTKPVGSARVRARWITMGDGLARFNGANVTLRADVVKEGQVTDQRMYMMQATLTMMPSAGELAAPGEHEADVMFQELGIMTALQAGQ